MANPMVLLSNNSDNQKANENVNIKRINKPKTKITKELTRVEATFEITVINSNLSS